MRIVARAGRFANQIFNLYPLGDIIHYQWAIDEDGEIVCQNFGTDSIFIDDLEMISDSVSAEVQGAIFHTFTFSDRKAEKVYSSYYPVSVYGRKMAIIYSTSKGRFISSFMNQNIQAAILTHIMTLFLVIFLLINLGRQKKKEQAAANTFARKWGRKGKLSFMANSTLSVRNKVLKDLKRVLRPGGFVVWRGGFKSDIRLARQCDLMLYHQERS